MRAETVAADRNEQFWTRPFRVLLSVLLVVLLTLVCGVLIAVNYQRGREDAIRGAMERMHAFSSQLTDRFHAMLDEPATGVELASVSEPLARSTAEDVEANALFLRTLARSPQIDGVYVGYPDGGFLQVVNLADQRWRGVLNAPPQAATAQRIITAQPDGSRLSQWAFLDAKGKRLRELPVLPARYDPRTRPWYRQAAGREGLIATPPYEMATTGALGITIAKQHQIDSKIVIGIDILLDTIAGFLSEQKVTADSQALILDASGKPIIHSDLKSMRLLAQGKAMPDESGGRLLAAIERAKLPDDQARFLSIAGDMHMAMATALDSIPLFAGHRLVVSAPLSELTAEAERGLLHGLLVSALVVASGICVALLFAAWTTRSLAALTRRVDRLQRLEFDTPGEVRSHVREISALAAAMAAASAAIRTFALYVPKELVNRIVQAGQVAGRSAKREEVTALFTDIYDFTTISEKNPPEEVVAMLSGYFDIFSDLVPEHNGSIIQFLGDSVFAMWNVPVADPDHAAKACGCALAIERALDGFNRVQRERGLPEFRTRFGIHTGPAVVGNVGGRERLQYTAMGDTINIASRLEGLNKSYGTTIIVSGAVRRRCGQRFDFRPLGSGKLKGRFDEVELFELVAPVALPVDRVDLRPSS
jgi:adenylate cyclase